MKYPLEDGEQKMGKEAYTFNVNYYIHYCRRLGRRP